MNQAKDDSSVLILDVEDSRNYEPHHTHASDIINNDEIHPTHIFYQYILISHNI